MVQRLNPSVGGVVFRESHLDGLIRSGRERVRLREARVIPARLGRSEPLALATLAGVFDHDAHAVATVVVGKIAHDPYARVVHFHNS